MRRSRPPQWRCARNWERRTATGQFCRRDSRSLQGDDRGHRLPDSSASAVDRNRGQFRACQGCRRPACPRLCEPVGAVLVWHGYALEHPADGRGIERFGRLDIARIELIPGEMSVSHRFLRVLQFTGVARQPIRSLPRRLTSGTANSRSRPSISAHQSLDARAWRRSGRMASSGRSCAAFDDLPPVSGRVPEVGVNIAIACDRLLCELDPLLA